MKRKTIIQLSILAVSVAVMLGLSWLVVQVINKNYNGPELSSSLPQSASASVPVSSVAPASSEPPVSSAAPVDETPQLPPREALALPENQLIDWQYFDTTVFVGDSITIGLETYTTGIPNAKYCAYKSIGPKGVVDGSAWKRPSGVSEVPLDALAAHQPDNVYILIGTNAIVGMDDAPFLEYYGLMLDTLKGSVLEGVSFYVQGITPVVEGVDPRFDKDRINALNDAIAQMATDRGMYYVNLDEVLAGEDGWLKPEYGAADGYHLTPEGYGAWADYLRRHTASNKRHDHLYIAE